MSHIKELKKKREKQRKWLFQSTGMNDLEYGNYQFDFAYQYLKTQLVDSEWIKQITRSQMFWKWWTNQWQLRDEQFIKVAVYDLTDLNKDQLKIAYEEWHKPDDLGFFINDTAYELMMNDVLKNEQSKCQKI